MHPKESRTRWSRVLRGLLASCLVYCLLVSGLCLVAPGPVLAQQAAGYSENFDDGQAQGWDFAWRSEGGKWVVTDGWLVGQDHAWVVCTDCYQPVVPYILRFELVALRGSLHVNVHVSRNDRLGVGFSYPGGDELGVYVVRGGEDARRTSAQVPFNLEAIVKESGGRGATIAIVVEEGYTEVHLQGAERNPVLAYKDSEPLRGGAFGFETLDGSYAAIDNLGIKQTEPEAVPWFLEGRVYAGEVGDEREPVDGVRVEAYGSNRSWPSPGEALAATTTEDGGWYRFEVPPEYEYYAIRVFPPPGDLVTGARSVYGTVRAEDWIEHQNPLPSPELSGDRFWIQPTAPEGPDLVVLAADRWHLENGGQSMLFEVEIQNVGTTESPACEVRLRDPARDWASGEGVQALAPGEVTVVAVRLEVPDDLRGDAYQFLVEVDPENRVAELDEENNRGETPVVEIPLPPPEVPTPTATKPPTDEGGRDGRWVLIVVGGAALLGGLGYAGWRLMKGGPEGSPTPVVPLVVPVRLMDLWLTEGTSGVGRRLSDADPLVERGLYSLHLQVPEALQGSTTQGGAGDSTVTSLSAVLFAPEGEFEFERRVDVLHVPEHGASNEIHCPFRSLRAGRNRLRACLYYGNVLVQSAYVDASVVPSGQGSARAGATATARLVDYVASLDLAGLDQMPQPDLSLFTNQAPAGTHWIGVYAWDGETGLGLASGDTITLSRQTLDGMARAAREVLAEIEGLQAARRSTYSYDRPFSQLLGAEKAWREKQLIKLACTGSDLFENLFIHAGMDGGREDNLWDRLQRPGIVSVARCRGESTSLPWALLYEQPLDTGREDEIDLCAVFKDWLAVANPPADATGPAGVPDLLADPQACRRRAACPLAGDRQQLTVCPFGFWGFLHQVEQPLQEIDPLPAGARDDVPEELREARRNQTSRLVHGASDRLELLMAVWPGFPEVTEHRAEIARIFSEMGLPEPVYQEERNEALALLQQGGRHLYYFFCHGEGDGLQFRLKLGPVEDPGYIRASDLSRRVARWPETPQPLVILNGCDTVAMLPERIHLLTAALRRLGACGVVGTEIQVFVPLAREVGRQILAGFLQGESLGEAFLAVRRALLRECNPMGLAYAFYAPATLHLHRAGCDWCRVHAGGG